jgi:HEAT repeat protein
VKHWFDFPLAVVEQPQAVFYCEANMPLGKAKPDLPMSCRRLVLAAMVLASLIGLAAIAGIAVGRYFARSVDSGEGTVIHFEAGKRLSYHVNFDVASASNFAAIFSETTSQPAQEPLLGLSHLFNAGIQSDLIVTVLESTTHHVLLAYQFRAPQVHFQWGGFDETERAQTIQTDLMSPIFCVLDAHGRVQSVEFDTAGTSMARRLVCTLLAAMQLVGPDANTNSGTQWDVEEEDPSGKCMAHYEASADGTIHKTKPRYLQPPHVKKGRTIRLVPTIQSTGEYVDTLDAQHHLVGVSAKEAQIASIQNREVSHGLLKLELSLQRKEEALPSELATLRTASAERAKTSAAVRLYEPTSPEQAEQNIQRQALGSSTLESLLKNLIAAEAGSPSENEITALFLKFKALAYIRPESCAQLGELLLEAKAGGLRMRILTDALQSAGNPQAQLALGSATLNRTTEFEAMRQLIPALGWIESPTPQTVETLQLLAFGTFDKDINTTARLALGNLARSLAADSPEAAGKIIDRLVQELKSASDSDQWELLLALGNAGSSQTLSILNQFQGNSDPKLRGTAVWAMRWIDSPEVDPLLANVLQKEPDGSVRLQAVQALQYRQTNPENVAAEEKALGTDSEAQVRIALLNNLWEARDDYPETKELVDKAAREDSSEDVRKAAAKLLDGAKGHP